MATRNYTNLAPPVALSVQAEVNATTLTVASTAGYPDAPFLLGVARGTADEEVMLCTAKAATTFTVTRGYDGTTAKVHEVGTSVEHTVAAIDYRESNQHINGTTGDHALVGEGKMWFAATLPDGYLWARGAFVSKATYPALWTLIGDSYLAGAAPQADNFRLPDLRLRVPIGKADSGTGSTLGGVGGTKDAVNVSHNHTQEVHGHSGSSGGGSSHGHGHNLGTNSSGTHTHGVDWGDTGDRIVITWPSGWGYTNVNVVQSVVQSNLTDSGSHTHSISGGVSNESGHTHGVTVGNATAINLASGVSGTDQNLPPYQVVNFILKY